MRSIQLHGIDPIILTNTNTNMNTNTRKDTNTDVFACLGLPPIPPFSAGGQERLYRNTNTNRDEYKYKYKYKY